MKRGGSKVDEEWLHSLFDMCTCKSLVTESPAPEVGTSTPDSAPPLRAEHQFRSGMQRAEHAKKNGAE